MNGVLLVLGQFVSSSAGLERNTHQISCVGVTRPTMALSTTGNLSGPVFKEGGPSYRGCIQIQPIKNSSQ